jgi:hypothetical protein
MQSSPQNSIQNAYFGALIDSLPPCPSVTTIESTRGAIFQYLTTDLGLTNFLLSDIIFGRVNKWRGRVLTRLRAALSLAL